MHPTSACPRLGLGHGTHEEFPGTLRKHRGQVTRSIVLEVCMRFGDNETRRWGSTFAKTCGLRRAEHAPV